MKKSIFLVLLALLIFTFRNGYGQENLTFTINGVSFEMIFVEGGTYVMNSTLEQGNCFSGEIITQKATLNNFFMSEFQVTQELWYAVMGTTVRHQWLAYATADDDVNIRLGTPSTFGNRYFSAANYMKVIPLKGEGNHYPIYFINYYECALFCNILNHLLADQLPEGYRFRIPTEAQWEYAARGGRMSKGYRFSGSDDIDEVAWFSANSEGTTYEVGKKVKNELGLYDMSGNVWEWCRDKYSDNYFGSNPKYVLRGGSWDYGGWACSTSIRTKDIPEARTINYGFRLSMEYSEIMSSN
jgi:formylglycine-generating enzyme required for sulfatase activity